MRVTIYILFKGFRKIYRLFIRLKDNLTLKFFLYIYNVKHENIGTNGSPFFHVAKNCHFSIGKNFRMNNGLKYNAIGFIQPCAFVVSEGAKLVIGNNVGISQTSIICQEEIIIKDFVKMGGGVKIYDSDFHSIKSNDRMDSLTDMKKKKTKKVVIGNHVFIGANSIILKGVTIGDNSVIGAGSVVAKSIPTNQIWAGNPAKFIKDIDSND